MKLIKTFCLSPSGLKILKTNLWQEANGMVCPSAEMEEFSKASCTNWDDVGGLQLLKLEFERRVVKRIKFPRVYEVVPFPFVELIYIWRPSITVGIIII